MLSADNLYTYIKLSIRDNATILQSVLWEITAVSLCSKIRSLQNLGFFLLCITKFDNFKV